jgi:hypothetical protein
VNSDMHVVVDPPMCACGLMPIIDEGGEVQEPTRLVSHTRRRCIDYHGRKITKAALPFAPKAPSKESP